MDNTLSDDKIEELLYQGYETERVDYKQSFSNTDESWIKITKDAFAMANFGGGYLIFGVQDGSFAPIGVEDSFHIDTSTWAAKLNKWTKSRFDIVYREYEKDIEGTKKKFPILYIKGIISGFIVPNTNGTYIMPSGESKTEFIKYVVYTRINTSSVPAQKDDFFKLFYSMISRAKSRSEVSSLSIETLDILRKKAEAFNIIEPIWSNLFPVIEMPDLIFVADTSYRDPLDIFKTLNSIFIEKGFEPPDYPGFLLKEEKIFSFEDYSSENNPLSMAGFSNIKAVKVEDLLKDDKKSKYLIELLNLLLKNACRRRGFKYDKKRIRFFSMFDGNNIPERTWKPAKRESTRPLVYLHGKEGFGRFYEHFGGKLRIVKLGNFLYLMIDPMRILTQDGKTPVDQKSSIRFHTKRNTQYRNSNYLYDMKFWVFLLSGNRQEILLNTLNNPVKISVKSLKFDSPKGILEDQNVDDNFLDELKSSPLEYEATGEVLPEDEENPLSENPLEG